MECGSCVKSPAVADAGNCPHNPVRAAADADTSFRKLGRRATRRPHGGSMSGGASAANLVADAHGCRRAAEPGVCRQPVCPGGHNGGFITIMLHYAMAESAVRLHCARRAAMPERRCLLGRSESQHKQIRGRIKTFWSAIMTFAWHFSASIQRQLHSCRPLAFIHSHGNPAPSLPQTAIEPGQSAPCRLQYTRPGLMTARYYFPCRDQTKPIWRRWATVSRRGQPA